MKSQQNFLLLIVFSLIIGGILIRLYFLISNSLWLDELYSIYYAGYFSFSKLLFSFNADVHPGFFYAYLKAVSFISTNQTFLRLVTGLLPQLLGLFSIVFYAVKNKTIPNKLFFLVCAVFFLFANPTFVYAGWQLRMYSLVFLVTVIQYCLLQSWIVHKKSVFLLGLVINSLLGQWLHFSFFFLSSAGLIYYLTYASFPKRKKITIFLISELLLIWLALFVTGFTVPFNYEKGQWIAVPHYRSIPSVYLTAFGWWNDIHNQNPFSFFVASCFYILFFGFVWWKRKKITANPYFTRFFFLVGIPIVTILLLSVILSFLSKRQFFYHFVPHLSLFLPRIHLPFVTVAYLLLAEIIAQQDWLRKAKGAFMSVLAITCFYWFWLALQTNTHYFSPHPAQHLLSQAFHSPKPIEVWPNYLWLYTLKTTDLKNQEKLTTLHSHLSADPLLSLSSCKDWPIEYENQTLLLTLAEGTPSQQELYQNALSSLFLHCTQTESLSSDNAVVTQWSCPNPCLPSIIQDSHP